METSEIVRELNRQQGKRSALLEQLADRNLRRLAHNAQLEGRRRYYKPKANGRGRPAKKIAPLSQENEARRNQYLTEIALLEEAIAKAKEGPAALVQWLTIERDLSAENKLRLRKIKALLDQFAGKKALELLPTAWKPEDVYPYLFALRARQRARVASFARLAVVTVGQQDDEDRERATLAVLERFCSSQHASSRQTMCTAAKIIAADPQIPQKLHDKSRYPALWREAVEGLAADLNNRFVS